MLRMPSTRKAALLMSIWSSRMLFACIASINASPRKRLNAALEDGRLK